MAPPAPKKPRTAPKFNAAHLDPRHARKLKKEWIATQKLKAKYRAEKRRMGLRKAPEEPNGDEFDGNAGERDDIAKAQLSDTESLPGNRVVEPDTTRRSPTTSTSPDTYPKLGPSKSTPSKPATSRRNTKTVTDEDNPKDGPSLRELAKEAYSPASLHTFKSHPPRRRPQGQNHGRAQVNHYPGRPGANGQRGAPPRGRGQPNMAKRMGVLLEKIKRSNQ
ncbi:unnamed protein product [Rhizoctonia solani]|uniref:rRNA-processing protein FYV7 n=1 Tax=Rhizoctonia solani TaxID=456999 RepID=A0A8H2XWS4_9AGAM|nr:unnamed protein product [Rhizoctonia solani]